VAVLPATAENIDRAAELLRGGAVVAFPTETVYGLGANALDARAVARIFEIKARPTFDPLIVHVRDFEMLARVARNVPDSAQALMRAFWPGPLTIVLQKSAEIPDLVTSGLPTVAVRMPSHPVARALLEAANLPLAAPSANPFGNLSPTRAEHVAKMLGEKVDVVLDGGATDVGIESTIVLLEPRPTLLRPGAIAVEEIERVIGSLDREISDEAKPLAPGRLPQHYSPRTPLRIIDARSVPLRDRDGAALLAFRASSEGYSATRVLSANGDLPEAATHLFEYLHELDAIGASRIDVEPVPAQGIGVAIMDRLRRASTL
jgi:L-threonylcarbamoyladenylate synthase